MATLTQQVTIKLDDTEAKAKLKSLAKTVKTDMQPQAAVAENLKAQTRAIESAARRLRQSDGMPYGSPRAPLAAPNITKLIQGGLRGINSGSLLGMSRALGPAGMALGVAQVGWKVGNAIAETYQMADKAHKEAIKNENDFRKSLLSPTFQLAIDAKEKANDVDNWRGGTFGDFVSQNGKASEGFARTWRGAVDFATLGARIAMRLGGGEGEGLVEAYDRGLREEREGAAGLAKVKLEEARARNTYSFASQFKGTAEQRNILRNEALSQARRDLGMANDASLKDVRDRFKQKEFETRGWSQEDSGGQMFESGRMGALGGFLQSNQATSEFQMPKVEATRQGINNINLSTSIDTNDSLKAQSSALAEISRYTKLSAFGNNLTSYEE